MDIDWKLFDPEQYVKDNYDYLHDEDRQILDILIPYYSNLPSANRAIEVGVGPNLYPLMLMLPKVSHIEAIDPNPRNISYLEHSLTFPDKNWQIFWEYISKSQSTKWINKLKVKLTISKKTIENLGANKYDLASTNFVLESITSSITEFNLLCKQFVGLIKPGGHGIATFMENSSGYSIGGISFPAVKINEEIIKSIFNPLLSKLVVTHINPSTTTLRPGYTGMLVLTGQK